MRSVLKTVMRTMPENCRDPQPGCLCEERQGAPEYQHGFTVLHIGLPTYVETCIAEEPNAYSEQYWFGASNV